MIEHGQPDIFVI